MRRRSLTLVCAVALLVGPVSSVQADPAPDDRVTMIARRLHALWMAGVPDAVRFETVEAEFGINVLNEPRAFEVQDVNNDAVESSRPTVWIDSFSDYPYDAEASFRWKYTCGEKGDEACWLHFGAGSGEGEVGGHDGFALKIDTPVKTKGGGLILDPNCDDKNLFYNQPSDKSDFGVGYHQPDTVDNDRRNCGPRSRDREYSWDSGSIAVNFATAEPCRRPRLPSPRSLVTPGRRSTSPASGSACGVSTSSGSTRAGTSSRSPTKRASTTAATDQRRLRSSSAEKGEP